MMRPLPVFLILCLLVFSGLYYFADQQDKQHSDNARLYLEKAMLNISRWDSHALGALLSPQTRDVVSEEQLQQLIDQYRHLGKFDRMEEPQYAMLTTALSAFGQERRLAYSFICYFEHGSALVNTTLSLREGYFSLYNFNIQKQSSD